jgi:hypothetical protein
MTSIVLAATVDAGSAGVPAVPQAAIHTANPTNAPTTAVFRII